MSLLTAPSAPAPGSSPTSPSPTSTDERILEATLRCVARWGVGKTTLDDVAREAGCSRATVYRAFPGGKDGLVEALVASELARYFTQLGACLEPAASLEDALVAGTAFTARWLAAHSALQFLLAHEPEAVLPHVAFRRMNDVLAAASAFVGPYLERWLARDDALRAAEWATRIVVSYTFCPADGVDLSDEASARRLVCTFILPGLVNTIRA
jgi:AcrR family transcriptional regulator